MLTVKSKQRLVGHVGRVWSVDWHPNGNILASCGEERNIRLWRQQSNEEWVCTSCIKTPHKRTLRRVKWSRCGKLLAVCSFDGTVSLWSKEESNGEDKGDDAKECDGEGGGGEERNDGWEMVVLLEGHENEVKGIDWSVDGEWFASCSRDKSVWIWKANQDSSDYECSSILTSHTQDVKMVVWHPVKQALYSTSYDNTVKCYQADDDDEWFCSSSFTPHTSTVWCISFQHDGNMAVTCAEDGGVKVWACRADGDSVLALDKWKCLAHFTHTRPVYHVSWSHTGTLIASGCGDNTIRIYGGNSSDGGGGVGNGGSGGVGNGGDGGGGSWGVVTEVGGAHDMDINSLSWNPSKHRCLASCGDDEVVMVWMFEGDE